LDRPGARSEPVGAVRFRGQGAPEALAKLDPVVVIQRPDIAGRRSFATEKRPPVIVQITEWGSDVDGPAGDVGQPGRSPKLFQTIRPADRETDAFVQCPGRRVQRDGGVMEFMRYF
jgi:hypothetical protein